MDCIADIGGELVLFQVKDKDFNLGDAYAFGAKVGMIRPEHSVVVSTERIGADAREHFDRAHRSRRPEAWHGDASRPAVRYIEGLETLGSNIEELAASIYQGDALRFLRRVLPLAGLKPQPLIQAMEQRASRRTDAPASPFQPEQASQAAVPPARPGARCPRPRHRCCMIRRDRGETGRGLPAPAWATRPGP